MKSTLKLLTAVSMIVGASGAMAAIDTDLAGAVGSGDRGGELFVSVFRNVPGQELSSLFDTGFTAGQLLDGTIASGTVVANVGSFFTTAAPGSYLFNAGAITNGDAEGTFGNIFTSNNTAGVATQGAAVGLAEVNSINVNMRTFVEGAQGSANTDFANNGDYLNLLPGAGGFHGSTYWNNSLGGANPALNTEAGLNTALALWAITINASFDGFTTRLLGYLTADVGSGDITYTTGSAPAVPLPAAVWLLGSGLAGLLGFSRRRRLAVA